MISGKAKVMKKVFTTFFVVLVVGISTYSDDFSNPSSYSANTWFLGPHLDKYRKSDNLDRIKAIADLQASDDEFVVRMGVDLLDLKKVPSFLKIYGRAFKAEPVETTTRTLVNVGTAAITAIGVAEGTDALGWTDFDILGQESSGGSTTASKSEPASPSTAPASGSGSVTVMVNDNEGEVTVVVGDDTSGAVQ